MKRLLSFIMVATLALMLAGCDKYDDSELRDRIGKLETSMSQLTGYQTLLQNLSAGKTVTAYSQSGNEITLTFNDGKSLTFNIKGEKGDSVKGDPGAPGEPGKTPTFKIENETWKVSYDEGKTWTDVGSAIDRSLIKDIKPNAAGDTLNITLADGTVIPVFYGEKEGFGFEVAGGRKCFSVLEKQEFFWGPNWDYVYYDFPYTLSGELANIEDVQFSVRVTPHSNANDSYGLASVNPTDANSGYIRIIQRPYYNEEYTYGYSDDGYFWKDYPGTDVEVVAYFPDHTSVFKSFKLLPLELGMQIHDDYSGDYAFEFEGNRPVLWLENTAGLIKLNVFASIYADYKYYDGDPLPEFVFDKMFNHSTSRPSGTEAFIKPALLSSSTLARENYWDRSFVINIPFFANTTGNERYMDYNVNKRTSEDRSYSLFSLRFKQSK